MGGQCRRKDPSDCEKWRRHTKVWSILQRGGLITFMERIHGGIPEVMMFFLKNWDEGMLNVGG